MSFDTVGPRMGVMHVSRGEVRTDPLFGFLVSLVGLISLSVEMPNVRKLPTSIGISSGPKLISHLPSITRMNAFNGLPRSINGGRLSVRFTIFRILEWGFYVREKTINDRFSSTEQHAQLGFGNDIGVEGFHLGNQEPMDSSQLGFADFIKVVRVVRVIHILRVDATLHILDELGIHFFTLDIVNSSFSLSFDTVFFSEDLLLLSMYLSVSSTISSQMISSMMSSSVMMPEISFIFVFSPVSTSFVTNDK